MRVKVIFPNISKNTVSKPKLKPDAKLTCQSFSDLNINICLCLVCVLNQGLWYNVLYSQLSDDQNQSDHLSWWLHSSLCECFMLKFIVLIQIQFLFHIPPTFCDYIDLWISEGIYLHNKLMKLVTFCTSCF